MPSRLEAFGIVLTEALARGLPCIARDAYVMPEIVTPGVSGALVVSDDAKMSAAAIAATLADERTHTRHAMSARQRLPQISPGRRAPAQEVIDGDHAGARM